MNEQETDLQLSPMARYFAYRFGDDERSADFCRLFSALQTAFANGHTVIEQTEELQTQAGLIISATDALAGEAAPLVYHGKKIWLYRIWDAERQLAQQLLARIKQTDILTLPTLDNRLNNEQKQAVEHALTHRLTLINGGPGTGKTFTISHLTALSVNAQANIRIALAAPTGKAAKRMEESLQQALVGLGEGSIDIEEAQTLHRLLGIGKNGLPRYHLDNPLPYDLVIIDEASMLSLELAAWLFSALDDNTRLVLLGDSNQLAAVDAGAVLHDISHHSKLKEAVITLKQSQRFCANTGIGQLAQWVLMSSDENALIALFEQYDDISCTPIGRQLYTTLSDKYQPYFDAVADCQHENVDALFTRFDAFRILTTGHHGLLGTQEINRRLARIHQERASINQGGGQYYNGLPLMVTVNDYNNALFNGDIGIVWQAKNGRWELHLPQRNMPVALEKINPTHLKMAYALTVHKSQGSEFGEVSLLLDGTKTQGLSRELLYTGITRAKNRLHLYADKSLLVRTAHTPTERSTGLDVFL